MKSEQNPEVPKPQPPKPAPVVAPVAAKPKPTAAPITEEFLIHSLISDVYLISNESSGSKPGQLPK
jgi:hypothetical protein